MIDRNITGYAGYRTTRRIQLRALWALIEVLEVEAFYSPAFKRHCLRT